MMIPGQTALMRIPFEAFSKAVLLVNPNTPCLEASYTECPGTPVNPPIEEK